MHRVMRFFFFHRLSLRGGRGHVFSWPGHCYHFNLLCSWYLIKEPSRAAFDCHDMWRIPRKVPFELDPETCEVRPGFWSQETSPHKKRVTNTHGSCAQKRAACSVGESSITKTCRGIRGGLIMIDPNTARSSAEEHSHRVQNLHNVQQARLR